MTKISQFKSKELRVLFEKRECNFCKWNKEYGIPMCCNPDLNKGKYNHKNQFWLCPGVRNNSGNFPSFCPVEPKKFQKLAVMMKYPYEA